MDQVAGVLFTIVNAKLNPVNNQPYAITDFPVAVDNLRLGSCAVVRSVAAPARKVSNFEIHPNPSSSIVNLTLSNSSKVLVSDLSGRVVKSFNDASTFISFSVQDLEGGVYLVTVVEDGGVVGSQRLVVK